MRTTKPFLKTTTALVLMASLALPAAAQSLSGMKQKEIMDGALAGTVDLGFDTSGMTRGQIRSRIVEIASQCRCAIANYRYRAVEHGTRIDEVAQ